MKRLLFLIVYLILYKYDMCCKHYDKIVICKEIFRERPPLEIQQIWLKANGTFYEVFLSMNIIQIP